MDWFQNVRKGWFIVAVLFSLGSIASIYNLIQGSRSWVAVIFNVLVCGYCWSRAFIEDTRSTE